MHIKNVGFYDEWKVKILAQCIILKDLQHSGAF